jgi:hypothetical protein
MAVLWISAPVLVIDEILKWYSSAFVSESRDATRRDATQSRDSTSA